MAEEMSLDDEIRELLSRQPFFPFVISLTSGEKHNVVNPGLLAMGGNVITLYNTNSGRTFFRKNQIVGVETQE